jgi:hypothetical protein
LSGGKQQRRSDPLALKHCAYSQTAKPEGRNFVMSKSARDRGRDASELHRRRTDRGIARRSRRRVNLHGAEGLSAAAFMVPPGVSAQIAVQCRRATVEASASWRRAMASSRQRGALIARSVRERRRRRRAGRPWVWADSQAVSERGRNLVP